MLGFKRFVDLSLNQFQGRGDTDFLNDIHVDQDYSTALDQAIVLQSGVPTAIRCPVDTPGAEVNYAIQYRFRETYHLEFDSRQQESGVFTCKLHFKVSVRCVS